MRVYFLGVRGSTPAPGQRFVRYGGNTSAIAVAHDTLEPTLLLDAGTGVRRLPTVIGDAPFRGTLLLSHLHWDHTHGLPFSRSLDHTEAIVDLHLPDQATMTADEALALALSPPSFPIDLTQMRGRWSIHSLEEGNHEFAGFSVTAIEVPHKGGRTFGFRVSDDSASLAYIPDHGPTAFGPGRDGLGERHVAALTLAAEVDLLIHDAQYTGDEFLGRSDYGHSTIEYATDLGARAGCRQVALFHHDPDRTDDELDDIAAEHRRDEPMSRTGPDVIVAREDLVLDIGTHLLAGNR